MKPRKALVARFSSDFLRTCICSLSFLLFGSALGQDAKTILDRSEAALHTARDLQVDYSIKMDIPAWAGLHMAGSLYLASTSRCYLTNVGEFVIHDGTMGCVTDGTNYLSVGSRDFQWEHSGVRTNLNEFVVKHLIYSGITPLIAAQVAFQSPSDSTTNQPSLATFPFPFLASAVTASKIIRQADAVLDGKAALKFSWDSQGFSGKPAITELWLDKTSMLPLRRLTSESGDTPVEETYSFRINQSLPQSKFDPWTVIRRRKLEQAIRNAETPDALLLKACRRSDVVLAAKSLAAGANPNAKSSMMDRPPSFSPLLFAAQAGNLELIKLLVEQGAEINAGALSGALPLQFACMSGKIATVSYLIEHGATLTNATASLCWAAWRGYSNIVAILVEKGVPIDESAGEVGTPLQRALQGGFVDIAAFLIAHGADINKSERGSPLLHTAVRFGTPETVNFLLKAGAKPNERDSYGMTPLMYAASGNHAVAAGFLLEHGADPQFKDPRGKTAMDIVSRHLANKEIITFFEQKGLIKAVQPNGKKP